MQNGTASLEDGLATSCQTRRALTVGSSACDLRDLPRGSENLRAHTNLRTNVDSFVRDRQNTKATEMSFSRVVDKLWLRADQGILLGAKRK